MSEKSKKLSRPPLARMLRLHHHLMEGRYPNCRKQGEELEVAPKTIQRDIDFMRDQLGLPIEYDEKKFGFYYTEKVGQFPTLQVSEGELVALFVAQKALAQYEGTSFHKPLETAFAKLTEGLNDEVSVDFGSWESFFSVRSLGLAVSDLQAFELVSRAVRESRELSFRYRKLNGRQFDARKLQPYHLASVDNQWYLIGHDLDRNAIRTFALTRMKQVRVLEKRFERPLDFSSTEYLRNSFGVFSGSENFQVRIRFDHFASQLIRERIWHRSQKIIEKRNGTVELELELGSLPEVERWILSWGDHATVLKPAALKKRVAETAKSLAARYCKDTE
jgi:predicted DNA-binding transcriptional regulator YafY